MENKQLKFTTRAIHAGQSSDPATGALATPIYQTTTFEFDNCADLQVAIDTRLKDHDIYFYSRGTNPTVTVLEKKIASLEGAESAVAAASGMGAICATLMSLLNQGDHVIASNDLFVCSKNLFTKQLPAKGIETTCVNILDLDNLKNHIKPNTKMIYMELLSNPRLELADLRSVVEIAHAHGLLLVVDNTFLSPYLIRPLEYGADLVVHSATKYIAGHGDALGGTVAGSKPLVDKVRQFNNDMGACMSPFNAWLILRGVRTLPLRMKAISQNAQLIAEFLATRPEVKSVMYPGLDSHPQHELAADLLQNGMGGIVSFYLHGDTATMQKFAESLSIPVIATSLGDVQTLIYPRRHDNNLIRLAVGCEDIEDLIADFKQAFEQLA